MWSWKSTRNSSRAPTGLNNIYVASSTGGFAPLSAFTHYASSNTALAVAHQGQFPAVTFTFNLAPNVPLGDAVTAVQKVEREIGLPTTLHPGFQGTAQAFQDSLASEPYLILAALATVYIVLGILYENYIHPITILSTLPSAGVGALLAVLVTHSDLDIIALIGIILLIGIVKKNAILMIDFAIQAERNEGNSPEQSIYQACLLRFRPIMMTTMAALFGGIPIAVSTGNGSELRRPLGIAICGGLIVSQDPYLVYDSGGLSLYGPPAGLGQRRKEVASPRYPAFRGLHRFCLRLGRVGRLSRLGRARRLLALLPRPRYLRARVTFPIDPASE